LLLEWVVTFWNARLPPDALRTYSARRGGVKRAPPSFGLRSTPSSPTLQIDEQDAVSTLPAPSAAAAVSLRTLLIGTGPRFARDAFGPVLTFYLVWKLAGLTAGIAAATLLALVSFFWERRHARSGLAATIGLTIAMVQAVLGLASGSARVYFAVPVIVNIGYGLAFLVSAAIGRPLAGVFAQDTYPFAPDVRASAIFRSVFSRISVAWGTYMLCRGALRLMALSWLSVDVFVVVNLLTGVPFTAALMTWSLWYALRRFRRSAATDSSLWIR
jgi:intracellular septation protein A